MLNRPLGRTGWQVSEVSFGAWAIGGSWGPVTDASAKAALTAALDAGVNFIDTADVYGDGRSEKLIADVLGERKNDVIVATKAGRRLQPHVASGYNRDNLTAFVERSLRNLRTEALDLVQLHCPPIEVYYQPEVFAILDELKAAGKIKHYGVSVEKVEEGLKALEYPGVQTVQIIFNVFRQRPRELFFGQAQKRDVGVIVRVPLASGLLSGKMTAETEFPADDHRTFNRHGEAFDIGETFAGVPFDVGLQAADEIRPLVPEGMTMAELALKWILMHDAVTCVIPGAKSKEQAEANASASGFPPLDAAIMRRLDRIYEQHVKPLVHQRW